MSEEVKTGLERATEAVGQAIDNLSNCACDWPQHQLEGVAEAAFLSEDEEMVERVKMRLLETKHLHLLKADIRHILDALRAEVQAGTPQASSEVNND